MFDTLLKQDIHEFMGWKWDQIAPYYDDLEKRDLNAGNSADWLSDWSTLQKYLYEWQARLSVATSSNTADADAKQRLFDFLDNVSPQMQAAEQNLKQKLLDSKLEPAGFEMPLRNMRQEADLYREANIPLFTRESKNGNKYDEIIGEQVIEWDGKELTLTQARSTYTQNPDRGVREQIWRLGAERQLASRQAINDLWVDFLKLRRQEAENAGYPNYLEFRWKQLLRFDYSPDNARTFHSAIEKVAVPAATRVYERERQRLGVKTLRPWDLGRDYVYLVSRPPLHPFETITELEDKTANIFQHVDPVLAGYFATMRKENLLDLANRKNKAPGAYCTDYPVQKRPFVFENAVGMNEDVETLLHEMGHAFHNFEAGELPYIAQQNVGAEFAEVASMSMEFLGSEYLAAKDGGFYSESDAARARIEHMEKNLLFWPFMAVVDSFQHWVYLNIDAAMDPANCDAKWTELWRRFVPGIDWSGLDQEEMTGWHRKLHIHQIPFYYVDYGLAQLCAVQVWRNSMQDKPKAVADYRHALSLGGTRTLPELYAAAGGKFGFDVDTLQPAIDLMEDQINKLIAVVGE